MANDATLDGLVDRVRSMINDPEGNDAVFDRERIEEALRRYRMDLEGWILPGLDPSPSTGLASVFSLGFGNFGSDAVLHDQNNVVVTADTIDLVAGRWVFTTPRAWPLYLTGYSYDPYSTAADLLEEWAAKITPSQASGQSRFGGATQYRRASVGVAVTDERSAKLDMALRYRKRMRVVGVPIGAV